MLFYVGIVCEDVKGRSKKKKIKIGRKREIYSQQGERELFFWGGGKFGGGKETGGSWEKWGGEGWG